MSAHEPIPLLPQVDQPLRYAETLLRQFIYLSGTASTQALGDALVRAAATLSGSELSQLYLVDDDTHDLILEAQWGESARSRRQIETGSGGASQLIASMQHHCHLFMDDRQAIAELLPPTATPWRSLLALPLHDKHQQIRGLLLVACQREHDLLIFADSLSSLGRFALDRHQLLVRLYRRPSNGMPGTAGQGLLGNSQAMAAVHRLLSKVQHNPVNVLLTGETGTGKELVARAIHEGGPRSAKAFVVQNCAALPESLLESELFGYRRGAFSGADRDHQGLLDVADGGTLLLDEVGDMPLALQAKLLRVLQEGEVRPLGCSDMHKIDVRIIAATHRDLRAQIKAGLFREDLFYRLAQFPIALPPLRERDEDILLLARHFAEQTCQLLQRPTCRWADGTLEHLASYPFPGNVRELKGMVERAVLLCDDHELLSEHFDLPTHEPSSNEMNLRQRLQRVERNLLLDCLRNHAGNRSQAARELGLPRRTLLYRMQRLKIHATDL